MSNKLVYRPRFIEHPRLNNRFPVLWKTRFYRQVEINITNNKFSTKKSKSFISQCVEKELDVQKKNGEAFVGSLSPYIASRTQIPCCVFLKYSSSSNLKIWRKHNIPRTKYNPMSVPARAGCRSLPRHGRDLKPFLLLYFMRYISTIKVVWTRINQ